MKIVKHITAAACAAMLLVCGAASVQAEPLLLIPNTRNIDLLGYAQEYPYTYSGTVDKIFHFDIDSDGSKETIAHYVGGSTTAADLVNIDGFWAVYKDGSTTPLTYYKENFDFQDFHNTHIIQDLNSGDTFLGYVTDGAEICRLSRLHPVEQNVISSYRDEHDIVYYNEYMQNVLFLDELAYTNGDLDGDAELTISDAGELLAYYAQLAAGLTPTLTDAQISAADANHDGVVDVQDAAFILNLYAEQASGLVDTLILPATTNDATFSCFVKLEHTFYLDIDQDGKKETIGRYTSYTDGPVPEYMFHVYDDGKFAGSFGNAPYGSMAEINYSLVYDHNTDMAYLTESTMRGAAMYLYSSLKSAYPANNTKPYLLYVEGSAAYEDSPYHETVEVNGGTVSRKVLLDYAQRLDVLSPRTESEVAALNYQQIFDWLDADYQ